MVAALLDAALLAVNWRNDRLDSSRCAGKLLKLPLRLATECSIVCDAAEVAICWVGEDVQQRIGRKEKDERFRRTE